MKNIIYLTALIAGMFLLAGCPPKQQKNSAEQQKMMQQHDSLDLKAKENQERIAQMPVQELFSRLSAESAQMREPFNAPAFIELKRRTNVTSEEIQKAINTSDQASLLGLLLLRQKDRKSYLSIDVKKRTAILLDALKKSETFNMWGLPHAYQEEAANALVECGAPALSELKPLLRDCRNIKFYGDEEYLEFKKYKYRFCDYVLFFYKTIKEEKFVMPEKPEERDLLIQQIK